MPYNYAEAFFDIDTETVKAASLVAVMNYREEFPDAEYVHVEVYCKEKCLDVSGGPQKRTYTFEELGFTV